MTNMKTILVTGACGEMGHALINFLNQQADCRIIALDLKDNSDYNSAAVTFIQGSVTDRDLMLGFAKQYSFDEIFHLAAILSTGGEKNPLLAQQVNIDGSVNVLSLARTIGEQEKKSVKVIFPSTIAVYGIPSLAVKKAAGSITEEQFLAPLTMYGINKLYVEKLGGYFDSHYRYLENPIAGEFVDFRAIRYPGILSAETVPSGGTSDYGPEMLHAVAQGLNYECFVNPESRIPFMVMPDAVRALIEIANAPRVRLTQRVYNVAAFSPSAKEIEIEIAKYFASAVVSYRPHQQRLNIVESWPENINDTPARLDWGWKPEFNFVSAFEKYLVPAVIKRYSKCNMSAQLAQAQVVEHAVGQ